MFRNRWRLTAFLAGSFLAPFSIVDAQSKPRVFPTRPAATVPAPLPAPLNQGSPTFRFVSAPSPAAQHPAAEVRPVEDGHAMTTPDCANGACAPYYRNRPYGHPQTQNRIKLYNRMNEPEWYRYYRCTHYGYYPTQWHAWPDGWLTCRHPEPGPHPYDIQRPKPSKRILDAERRRLQLEEEGSDPLRDNIDPPANSQELPKELPPAQPGPLNGDAGTGPLAPPATTPALPNEPTPAPSEGGIIDPGVSNLGRPIPVLDDPIILLP